MRGVRSCAGQLTPYPFANNSFSLRANRRTHAPAAAARKLALFSCDAVSLIATYILSIHIDHKRSIATRAVVPAHPSGRRRHGWHRRRGLVLDRPSPIPLSLLARDGLLPAAAAIRADADAARDQRRDVHDGGRLAGVGRVDRVLAAQGVYHEVLVLRPDQVTDHRLHGARGGASGVRVKQRTSEDGDARGRAGGGSGAGGAVWSRAHHHDHPEDAQHRAAHAA